MHGGTDSLQSSPLHALVSLSELLLLTFTPGVDRLTAHGAELAKGHSPRVISLA